MNLTLQMQAKLAFIAAGLHLRKRDAPVTKPKSLYFATLQIRTEPVEGGSMPEDEVQLDFVISSAKRDAHFSYMSEDTLRNYATNAQAGVPFMLDHASDMEKQIGRTIAGTYNEAEKRTEATISMLRDTDSTPENMRINEYIRRIERKFYDSCSVGFRDGQEICRLDGKDVWDWSRDNPCPHIPGRSYDGKLCEYDVNNAFLRELSLVPSGSNTDAKQLDRSTWEDGLQAIKKEDSAAETNPKSLLERDGEKWREQLILSAIKEGVRAEDTFDETKWRERFKTQDSDFIVEQAETWKKLGDAKWGKGGRKTDSGIGKPNTEPTLWLPESLFRV